tara:strand:+ start:1253 stop:1690 length:438 start_codon:yes stop_codon:yes gene_type:complete
MAGSVSFPVNYNTSVINEICDGDGRFKLKEFGRSLIHNGAMLFGMGHVADYKFGKNELQIHMENMKKDMEKKKWEITMNLFEKQLQTEESMISVMNEVIILLQQQGDYYDSIFDPQFQSINLLDNFRIILLLSIVFILITFINWK